MDLGLKDKTVLVMAAGSGIGNGIAMEFAKEGANLMLFGHREATLKSAQSEIRKGNGVEAEYCVGDITCKSDIERAVQRTLDRYGSIYALINNTGGPSPGGFDDFDDDAWQQAFELTLLSYIRSIRAVLPVMKAAKRGRILNNTSSSIKSAIDNLILSNVFRTGILGLSKSLARELAPLGILVNTIGAGKIKTGRVTQLDTHRAESSGQTLHSVESDSASQIPVGRYGTTEEIARLAVFLCSEANTYITGQSILADGGMVSAY